MSQNIQINELDNLFQRCATNVHEAVLVAPYIKLSTIEWLLSHLSEECHIRVLTRARLTDFVLESSDIDAWPLIWNNGGEIFIEQSLHAKYYRFDKTVLIGSANISDSALNLSLNSNLELIGEFNYDKRFEEIESQIFLNRTKASRVIYKQLSRLIENNKKKLTKTINKITNIGDVHDLKLERVDLPDQWCFKSKTPKNLWWACSKPQALSSEDLAAAQTDLNLLKINPNKISSEKKLHRAVGLRLNSCPIVLKLHHCFDKNETPDRPYLSYGYIQREFHLENDRKYNSYQGSVNAFFDWMITFLPNVFFEAPRNHSRLIGRYKDIIQ